MITSDPNDPRLTRGTDDHPVPMAEAYLVLSEEERAAGFVRPVRRSYVHETCGTVTTMGQAIAETYARNPGFYGATYCCACRMHRPVGPDGEFVWADGTGQKVGLMTDEQPRAEQVLPRGWSFTPASDLRPRGIAKVTIGEQEFVPARLLDEADQRAELLRRQVDELTRERDDLAHDPAIRDVDGRIVVDWIHGRGPVVVMPEVIDGWAESVNRERAEVERLRGLLAAADEYGDRHVIDLREDGWTIAHPLSCRAAGLFRCPLNGAATDLAAPPALGRFEVSADADGRLQIGAEIRREAGLS